MKNSVLLLVAAAAAVSAQLTLENNTYTCAQPNVAYCAGDSLKTDIIVRCDNKGHGIAGRCGDNLDGEPPVGNTPALCFQTDDIVGDASCEKNCVVYGGSGNGNGTWTLPTELCKPTFTASTTETSATETGSATTATSTPIISDTVINPSDSIRTTVPIGTLSSIYPTNGSIVTITSTAPGDVPTGTPIKPTVAPTTSTAGGAAVHVGAGLAALGLVAAYII